MRTFDFNGVQFASFTYTNAYGVVSNYKVLLGVTYAIGQQKDLLSLIGASFTEQNLDVAKTTLATALVKNMIGKEYHSEFFVENMETLRLANVPKINEMLDTFEKDGDTKQYQSNQSIAQEEGYEHLDIKGMKICLATEELHIQAQFVSKSQTEEQKAQTEENIASGNFKEMKPKKEVKSQQATLDKNEVKKALDLRGSKIRSFIFEEGHMESARINGDTLIFD